MSKIKTSFAQEQLRSIIERIERLNSDRKVIGEDISAVFSEAKGNGFNSAILRKIIALRKKSANEREEEEAILDLYLGALGMTPIEEEIAESKAKELEAA